MKAQVPEKKVKLDTFTPLEEQAGKLDRSSDEDKLMKSVTESDKQELDESRLVQDGLDNNLSSFSPNLMFEQLVENYSLAKSLYGESILRWISGYNPNYIKKNIQIPEFQRELKKEMMKRAEDLQKKDLLDDEYAITEKAMHLATFTLALDELDHLQPKGFGEREFKKKAFAGSIKDVKSYARGDRYRDIALKRSIKTALRRGHTKLLKQDLKVFEHEARGQIYVVYCLDSSGSMKGKKIGMAKKAGVALAWKALSNRDKVGLITFGSEIKDVVEPTQNFLELLLKMNKIKASKETNMTETIDRAIRMFPDKDVTKHVLLLTDAMPTIGKKPEQEVLEACSRARNHEITISLIGTHLDEKGEALARKIVEIGGGRMYKCVHIDELDQIVLEDYASL